MSWEIQVDTDELYAAGCDLADSGDRILSFFQRVATETAAYDGVCGADEYGDLIVKGENGYSNAKTCVIDAGSSRGQVAVEFGTGLADAATTYEQVEEENAAKFR